MILIEFPEDLPDEIEVWKRDAEVITESIVNAPDLATKHELIEQHKGHWRKPELINWLSDLSYEKCWYTETKFGGDYQELEHFRPKKGLRNKDGSEHSHHDGYNWLAFDLDNYRLCKRRPNAKKGVFFPILDERLRACCDQDDCHDELPLFLDPMDEEDVLLLSFDDSGKPVPEIDIEVVDAERVEFTIEKYYLDERVLNIRRAQTWKATRDLYYKYLNQIKAAKNSSRVGRAKLAEAKKDLIKLKEMLEPNQEFSSVAKASLIKTGDRQAIRIAASR